MPSFTPDINDDAIMTALRSFLLSVLDPSVEVLQGQQNRVPEPSGDDFIIMTNTSRTQLSTTTHSYDPVAQTNAVGRSNSSTIQLDVYGPNSNDNAQVIATLFRDSYGCDAMAASGVQPLYCDDGQQMPLVNGEFQYQDRWTLKVVLQANPAITIPVQSTTQAQVASALADARLLSLLFANDVSVYITDQSVYASGTVKTNG